MLQYFEKILSAAFVLFYKMRYILWVVALLEACDVTDVTKHSRYLGFCLTCKITHINKYFASFHSQDLLLSLKELEKHAFSLKNGLNTCYL